MTYAYARVSSRDQNLDRQLSAFRSFGIPPKHIFCDKKSGKMIFACRRKYFGRIFRNDLLPNRKISTHAQDAACDMMVASAAPCTPMSNA